MKWIKFILGKQAESLVLNAFLWTRRPLAARAAYYAAEAGG